MSQPRDLEIVKLVQAVKGGELKSTEIARSCLQAVQDYNGQLKSFISLDQTTILAQSRAIDSRRTMKNKRLPGIPIAVKDLIDVAGQVTTAGSLFFRRAKPALTDAPIIQRLREAGVVIFGKANLHEFAWGGTSENPHFGICRNPWNPMYCTGGSSGGSGAAVAARMVPGALGTDTLGSIRIPSSFCGTVGLKPTYGLLPTQGIFPLAYTFDHVGPMARTTGDVEMIFEALLDDEARRLLRQNAKKQKVSFSKSKPLKGIKIGLLKRLVPQDICHKTTWQQYQRAFDFIENEGGAVVEEHIPEFESALSVAYILASAQASEIHRERMAQDPEKFGHDVKLRLELGYLISGIDYIRAQRLRMKLAQEAMKLAERVDAWVFPTTPQPASLVGGPPDFNVAFFTAPVCAIGFPSIAIPSGLTPEGLPVSIQVISGPYKEYLLMDIAKVLEDRFDFPKILPFGCDKKRLK